MAPKESGRRSVENNNPQDDVDDDDDVARCGACNRMTFNVGMAEGREKSFMVNDYVMVVTNAMLQFVVCWMPMPSAVVGVG